MSCIPTQHPWNSPFWEVFGLLLPQVLSDFAEFLTRGCTIAKKKKNLKDSSFYVKGANPKSPSPFPLKIAKIKITGSAEKLQPLGNTQMSKLTLYLLSLFPEQYD